jgi:hypothetical protein
MTEETKKICKKLKEIRKQIKLKADKIKESKTLKKAG